MARSSTVSESFWYFLELFQLFLIQMSNSKTMTLINPFRNFVECCWTLVKFHV